MPWAPWHAHSTSPQPCPLSSLSCDFRRSQQTGRESTAFDWHFLRVPSWDHCPLSLISFTLDGERRKVSAQLRALQGVQGPSLSVMRIVMSGLCPVPPAWPLEGALGFQEEEGGAAGQGQHQLPYSVQGEYPVRPWLGRGSQTHSGHEKRRGAEPTFGVSDFSHGWSGAAAHICGMSLPGIPLPGCSAIRSGLSILSVHHWCPGGRAEPGKLSCSTWSVQAHLSDQCNGSNSTVLSNSCYQSHL